MHSNSNSDKPGTSTNTKKYFQSYTYYQGCIKSVVHDELNMVHETDEMINPQI